MLTGIYQVVPVILVVVAYYWIDTWFTHRFNPKQVINAKRDWTNTVISLVAIAFIVIQPFVMPWLGLRITAWWGVVIQVVGLICVIAGIVLIVWVRIHLKQFFSEHVELQPNHRLVNTGPYFWVRHPLYTAFLLIALGLFLINPALIQLLLLCFAAWHYSKLVGQEEVLLGEKLAGYADYAVETPRFIPNLWRSSKHRE